MAYEKQTWSSNELITADKLNHIEEGIPTKTSQLTNDSGFLTSHQSITGKKNTQSAVSSPTASGTTTSFIDTISQDTQGVITATKKTVSEASTSAAGLMSATDKTKLDGIASGAQVNSITGVKGDAESSYRTGNVNLTPANIGAVAKAGDTMTGILKTNSDIKQTAGYLKGEDSSDTSHAIKLGHNQDNKLQFFEYGGQFDFYQSQSGANTLLFQIKNGNSEKPLPVNNGGTGATIAAAALAALSQLQLNTAWKTAPNGLSLFFYEGSNNTTTYDLPLNNMILAVLRWSQNRGIVFGFPWDSYSATKLFYRRIYDAQNADSWHSVSLS